MTSTNQFIQRNPLTHTGTITFSGTRATLYRDGVHLATSTTGSFQNVAQGSGYIETVFNADGTKTRETVTIGAIVDVMGASNMSHWFSIPGTVGPAANTFQLNPSGVWADVRGGAAQEFTANLSAELGCPVAIIDSASSDSALLQQDANSPHTWWDGGPAYSAALNIINSVGGRVEDVLWGDGEQDGLAFAGANAAHDTAESEFQAGLTQFFSTIEQDMGAPQIFIQQIGDTTDPLAETYFQDVGQAEQNVANLLNYVDIGADAVGEPLLNERHYTPAAYLDLASQMATSISQFDLTPPPPPPVIKITQNTSSFYALSNGASAIVAAGVAIVDPSFAARSVNGEINAAGIGNPAGGNDQVAILGTVEGYVGAYFREGPNAVEVKSGGVIDGYHVGAEFYDGGHNLLVVKAGGAVVSNFYGVWIGDTPDVDYTLLPNAGADAIYNQGLIEGARRDAIRMVEGGNHIVNTGTILSHLFQAIEIDSAVTDPHNVIANSGSILAGAGEAAIVSGDAKLTITNTGQITGDIQFGAGNDHLSGDGTIDGTIYGGAGSDTLIGGTGNVTFDGGAGADSMRDGTGVNTYIYNSASESTGGLGVDTIDGFDFSKDQIVIAGKDITTFDHIQLGSQLQPGEAALLENSKGDWFIVVDANGIAGYQHGADYLIQLTHAVHMP